MGVRLTQLRLTFQDELRALISSEHSRIDKETGREKRMWDGKFWSSIKREFYDEQIYLARKLLIIHMSLRWQVMNTLNPCRKSEVKLDFLVLFVENVWKEDWRPCYQSYIKCPTHISHIFCVFSKGPGLMGHFCDYSYLLFLNTLCASYLKFFSSALSFSWAEVLSPGIVQHLSVCLCVRSSVRSSVNQGTNPNDLSYHFHILPVDPLRWIPSDKFFIFQISFSKLIL